MHATVLLTAIAVGSIGVSAAQAGTASRAWVSGHGVDRAGCGAPTAPCRSLQYAHDEVVAAGGEIDILDPAGYGAVAITKSVSIVNDGVGTAGVQATSGDAISIDIGPSDSVYLRGLNVDGVGHSGADGIALRSGGELTVVNCVIRRFSDDGVLIAPSAGTAAVLIENSLSTDNVFGGVAYFGGTGPTSATLTFDRVIVAGNSTGFDVENSQATGSLSGAISNSISAGNSGSGVFVSALASTPVLTLDNDRLSANRTGVLINSVTSFHLTRTAIYQNLQYGLFDNTGVSNVRTAGDNRIAANGLQDVSSLPFQPEPLQ